MNHFAKLYLDEDVSVILAKVLSGRGFDVLTAKDADMLRKSDEEQLLFGTKHFSRRPHPQPSPFREATLGFRAKAIGAFWNCDRRPARRL